MKDGFDLEGTAIRNMSVQEKDDLEEVLTAIQTEEDLSCDFGAFVTAMIWCKERLVVGLRNGQMVIASIGTSIVTTVMLSETGHSASVTCLAITPNRLRVVSGSEDQTVRIWNLKKGREDTKLEGHTGPVTCVAITPNGKMVVSGSADHTIRVWNEGWEKCKFEGHTGPVFCLAITPDGDRVVSGSADHTVRVWNLHGCRERSKFEGHTEDVKCLAITPDGSRVVSGSADKTVQVCNLSERREEAIFKGHSWYVNCLAITPDGSRVVSGSEDNTLRVWNLAERKEEAIFKGHSLRIICVAITPDGDRVVSGSLDQTVRVWSMAERREETLFEGHSDLISCLAIAPDGRRLVSGSNDRRIRVWNLAERRKESTFEERLEFVRCLAITPDGSKIVCASSDLTIRVWNLAEGREEAHFAVHSAYIFCVAITPDGSRVVSCSADKTIQVWILTERREEAHFEGHTGPVTCLAVTPDGWRVVSGSKDRTIRVWNLAECKEETTFRGHTGDVFCLAITLDGSKVVSGSADKTIRVWNLIERREEAKLEGHSDLVYCLAITPDALKVVSGSEDQTIRVWNLAQHREEAKFEEEQGMVYCLAITPDGARVVSGSADKTVRVRNLAEHREETKFEGHTGPVICLAITPDGSRVVSGSNDKTIRVWNLAERRKEKCVEAGPKKLTCFPLLSYGSKADSDSSHSVMSSDLEISDTYHAALQTPSDLRLAIKEWQHGKGSSCAMTKCIFPSHHFNGLHICAFYNRSVLLEKYLKAGVPLIYGYFGTPLTLAIQRNSVKCVDVILQFFISRLEDPNTKDEIWPEFDLITEDLPQLLACKSSLLNTFFGLLMRTPLEPSLPDFITPVMPLPLTVHLLSRFIDIADFDEAARKRKKKTKSTKKKRETKESVLAKFLISLPRWNFTAGSEQSVQMLSAFAECEDKLVLTTPYVSTIIEDKWNRYYTFTVTVTLLYVLLLCAISGILFLDATSLLLILSFLALNSFFMLYELARMFAMGTAYFCELLNWVDVVRGVLSAPWAFFLLCGQNPIKGSGEVKSLTLVVVVLCYLRGFSYFRSFKMTRIFVYMTLAVVKETYSFLLILWYSVLAFGVFSAVLLEFDTIAEAWTSGYSLLMGNFDNSTYGFLEWLTFTGATMTNVVIMLNLLISILGEAYEKTQMSMRENDLHQQLTLILEYESLLRHRKDSSRGTVVVTCRRGEHAKTDEWQGHIRHIACTLKNSVDDSFAKVCDKITEGKVTGIGKVEDEIAGLKQEVTGMKGKVSGIEGKVTRIEGKAIGIEEEMIGIKEKMTGMEEQLKAILGLLSPRS